MLTLYTLPLRSKGPFYITELIKNLSALCLADLSASGGQTDDLMRCPPERCPEPQC